eukprot:6461323-Amphidinium_carterae.3
MCSSRTSTWRRTALCMSTMWGVHAAYLVATSAAILNVGKSRTMTLKVAMGARMLGKGYWLPKKLNTSTMRELIQQLDVPKPLDVWQPKQLPDQVICRYDASQGHEAYATLQQKGFIVNLPTEACPDVGLVWLPKGSTFDDALAQSTERTEGIQEEPLPGWTRKISIVEKQVGGKLSFALTVPIANLSEVKQGMGLDSRPAYVIRGAPRHWAGVDLEEVLRPKWQVTAQRSMAGNGTWMVRAEAPPSQWSFLAANDRERCTLQVAPYVRREREKPEAKEEGGKTWGSLLRASLPSKHSPALVEEYQLSSEEEVDHSRRGSLTFSELENELQERHPEDWLHWPHNWKHQ